MPVGRRSEMAWVAFVLSNILLTSSAKMINFSSFVWAEAIVW